MKALVGAFNQEKALVGAFSVIVKTDCETDGALHSTSRDRRIVYTSSVYIKPKHRPVRGVPLNRTLQHPLYPAHAPARQ